MRRRQVGELRVVAAVLLGHDPGRQVPGLLRGRAQLADQTRQLLRRVVVAAVNDQAADIEPLQLLEDRRAGVPAREAEEEQLGDGALERQAPRQIG